ncbi:hypothetical protein C1933_11675 [Stenotrophomonas sp. ZAC14D2_NAIMI4_6]|nr:hypothetical protein C1933_11675 [Stenotrophomonas sp. ZAC14D2_NAIMI4_6]
MEQTWSSPRADVLRACIPSAAKAFKAAPPFRALKAAAPVPLFLHRLLRVRPASGSRPGGRSRAPSKESRGGASVSELTEREARRKAVEDCEKRAGGRCRVEFVYHQQCVAAVVSELESTGTIYVSEATVEAATELALEDCRKAGGKQCRSIYSACTVPYFKKY